VAGSTRSFIGTSYLAPPAARASNDVLVWDLGSFARQPCRLSAGP
jgi:hypothetical protein